MERSVPNNRRAVVTGTSSGIGKAIALALLDEGWQVTGFDVAAASIAHAGFDGVLVDLCDGGAAEAAATRASGAQALIHAAGVLHVGKLGNQSASEGEKMWRVHVDSAARIGNILIPAMAARGAGRVVLIGSRVARGKAGRSQYSATKAALIAMARSWAAAITGQDIQICGGASLPR